MEGWVSPRTGVKFALRDGVLELTRPDGVRFLTYDEIIGQRALAARLAAKLRELGVDPSAL
jgi:hypothetical protein